MKEGEEIAANSETGIPKIAKKEPEGAISDSLTEKETESKKSRRQE